MGLICSKRRETLKAAAAATLAAHSPVADDMSVNSEWHRFTEVTQHISPPQRLFRASAPNYDDSRGKDCTQHLTQSAVDSLHSHQITRIISLNAVEYTPEEQQRLSTAGIAYLHLPVADFGALTIDKIEKAVTMWAKAPPAHVLVHCGYGHGRTGTLITAIQLWMTKGHLELESAMQANHVERDEQREVLREYQRRLVSLIET